MAEQNAKIIKVFPRKSIFSALNEVYASCIVLRGITENTIQLYKYPYFQDESSVQQLIEACITDEDKLYLCVSSPTIKDKPVQIRPWRLSDADFVLDASMPLDPRKTVFVGGVPRPLKAGKSCTVR